MTHCPACHSRVTQIQGAVTTFSCLSRKIHGVPFGVNSQTVKCQLLEAARKRRRNGVES